MCNVAAEKKKSFKEIGKLLKLDHQDPNELLLKSWLWRPTIWTSNGSISIPMARLPWQQLSLHVSDRA